MPKPKKTDKKKVSVSPPPPPDQRSTQEVASRNAAIRSFLVANRGLLGDGRQRALLNESKANHKRLREDTRRAKEQWIAKNNPPTVKLPTQPTSGTTPTTPTTPTTTPTAPASSGGASPTQTSPWTKAEGIYNTGKWVTAKQNKTGTRLYRDRRGMLWRVWPSGKREKVGT